jgi:hypothetical protein
MSPKRHSLLAEREPLAQISALKESLADASDIMRTVIQDQITRLQDRGARPGIQEVDEAWIAIRDGAGSPAKLVEIARTAHVDPVQAAIMTRWCGLPAGVVPAFADAASREGR